MTIERKANLAVGKPVNRVDGRLKVTGTATFSAEYPLPGLLHAVLVQSTIARGKIRDHRRRRRPQGARGVGRVHPPGFAPS